MNLYQVPHLTQYTTLESDKNAIKHNIQDSQEASSFPADDHKAAINRQGNMTNPKYSQRASNTFNQVVEAKRFEDVFLYTKVC